MIDRPTNQPTDKTSYTFKHFIMVWANTFSVYISNIFLLTLMSVGWLDGLTIIIYYEDWKICFYWSTCLFYHLNLWVFERSSLAWHGDLVCLGPATIITDKYRAFKKYVSSFKKDIYTKDVITIFHIKWMNNYN